MKSRWLSIWFVVSALLVAGPVSADQAAHAGTDRASDYYEQAQILFHKGDLAAAVIQLKNALQQNPQLLPARVLLGQVYVHQGDGAAGEHELLRADRLGADPSMTTAPLAKAYLQQAKYKELLDRLQPAAVPVEVRAQLLVSRGHAYLALGKLDQARHSFQTAAQLRPDDAAAVVGQALVRLRRGDIKGAGELADRAVHMAPKDADAWDVKASVSHLRGDLQQAQEDLAYIDEHFPHEPRASYLRGLLLARQGDTKASRAAMLECVATVSHLPAVLLDRRPQLLLLGGLVNYSLKQWEKSRDYLQRYLGHNAGDVGARKLLGAILIKSKEFDQAAEVLEPALKAAPDDYRLLALLGTVYMNQHRYVESTAMRQRAAKLSGNEPDIRVDVAINHLAAGNNQLGLTQLAGVFRQHPEQMSAGVVLAVHYLRTGKPARAAEVAAKLSTHYPHNLAILNLLGTAQARAGQREAGRPTFDTAVPLAPSFVPAKVALARLDLAGGRPEAARRRLSAILRTHPENLETLSALAEV
jgi:tetratricopeptide (TPR) repeat protein